MAAKEVYFGQVHEPGRPCASDFTHLTNLQVTLGGQGDRLTMGSLEQIRAIFDQGGMGLVLIGMPGLEKRLARYPQLYSRVGFVHEFSPLAETETRGLLLKGWKPPGVKLPDHGLSNEEALAAILRITGGNFRLLNRLLTQISRVLEINELQSALLSSKQRGKAWSLARSKALQQKDSPPVRGGRRGRGCSLIPSAAGHTSHIFQSSLSLRRSFWWR